MRPTARAALGACLFALLTVATFASAETIQVTVVDARDHAPIGGAFVMVGPAKGIPFAGNTGFASPAGIITFTIAGLAGPQTVTAGAAGFAYSAVIASAVGTVTLPLYPSVAQTGIYGPKARVTGQVTGIGTVSNDGKLDIAMVLPAISIDAALGGSLPIEVPPDTTTFPVIGEVVLPGNVTVPTQTEYFILQFSKPDYKMDLPAQTTQSMYAITARIAIADLINFPSGGDPTGLLKRAEIREFGIERNRPVGNGATIPINADIDLRTQLTVGVVGAPNGSDITVLSLGSLPLPGGGEEIVGYDTDFALADTLGAFLLASSVPSGDIGDIANLVAGIYQDSSAYAAFSSGRIDRTHFTLPATRSLADFYAPPELTRQGARLFWDDVHTGSEPAPTWSLHSISAGPLSPTDSTVATTLLWRIIAPAAAGEFALPSLPAEAPGFPAGLVDVDSTPEADRLIWSAWIANPSGDLTDVLVNPMDGVTHFSSRDVTLDLRPAGIADAAPARERTGIHLRPNPAHGPVGIRFDSPSMRAVRIEILDPSGRRIASLDAAPGSAGATWDGRDALGRIVPPGMYLIRSLDPAGGAARKVFITR
jgi:hypothetical protein